MAGPALGIDPRYGPGTSTSGMLHPSSGSRPGRPMAYSPAPCGGPSPYGGSHPAPYGGHAPGRGDFGPVASPYGMSPCGPPPGHSMAGSPLPPRLPPSGMEGGGGQEAIQSVNLQSYMDQLGGLGHWNELIAGGVVDTSYIEQEAERRKKEIERAMDNQVAQLETHCQEQRANIQQQAEYHTQMAERQIESHKRQHLAHVTRQAEIQAYAILQRAEMEKGRLGQEAARALSAQSEREKAIVLHDSMRQAEDIWRQSQRALLEQARKAKSEIDSQASRRTADIEREVRQAVARIYISPQSATNPIGVQPYGSFLPSPGSLGAPGRGGAGGNAANGAALDISSFAPSPG